MVAYIAIAMVHHIPVTPVGPSLMLAGVQAFLVLKWGLALAFCARKYRGMLVDGYNNFD